MSSLKFLNNYEINSEFDFDEIKRKKIFSPFENIKLSNKSLRNDSEKNRFYLYQQTNYLINNNPLMRKIFLNNYDSNKKIIINNNDNNNNKIPSLLRKKKLTYKKLIDNNSYKNFKLNIELNSKKNHILNFSPFSTNSKLFTNSIEKETPKLNKNFSQKNLNLNSIETSTLYLTKKSKISLSSSNVSLSVINNYNEDYNSEKNIKINKNFIINNKKKDFNKIYKISNKLIYDINEINSNIKHNLRDELYSTNYRNNNNNNNKFNYEQNFPSLENLLKKYNFNEFNNNNNNNEKTINKSKSLSNFEKVSINLNKFNENNNNYFPELFNMENDNEKNKNKKFIKNFGAQKYMLMKEGNYYLTNYGDIFCKMEDDFFEKNKMIILKKYPELEKNADLKKFIKDINKDKKLINKIKKFNNNHKYIIRIENKNKKLFDKVKKKVEFEIKKNKKFKN